ncbi:MAG: helix-hairpin-helix domain-containing protein [Candidatus Marinimicrobia bacterium]|nr:helix-hairpin-helix domain-containing protein [Candidatus Neomarinimicrobiota bacterium]
MRIFTSEEKKIVLALSAIILLGVISKIIKEKVFLNSSETLKLIAVSDEIKGIYSDPDSIVSSLDSLSSLINLNTADEIDLVSLPGVGPSLAKKIIAKRNELNGFKTIDDILKVSGIGEKKMKNFRSKITIK